MEPCEPARRQRPAFVASSLLDAASSSRARASTAQGANRGEASPSPAFASAGAAALPSLTRRWAPTDFSRGKSISLLGCVKDAALLCGLDRQQGVVNGLQVGDFPCSTTCPGQASPARHSRGFRGINRACPSPALRRQAVRAAGLGRAIYSTVLLHRLRGGAFRQAHTPRAMKTDQSLKLRASRTPAAASRRFSRQGARQDKPVKATP